MRKIIKYILIDILKNKTLLGYTFLLLGISLTVLQLEDSTQKGLLTLLNLALYLVPLVTLTFSTTYIYNSAEFIEVLVSQPNQRNTIWIGLFWGLSLSFSISFFLGIGIPVLFFIPFYLGILFIGIGLSLCFVFVSLAMVVSVYTKDKAKGLGWSLLVWMGMSILFDGLLLFLTYQLSEYPIEKYMVGFVMLNPIDLARIAIILKLDISAILGYSGALFQSYFGSTFGIALSGISLLIWIILPLTLSLRKFRTKDL